MKNEGSERPADLQDLSIPCIGSDWKMVLTGNQFSRKATDLVRECLVHRDRSVYPLQPGLSMSKALPVATSLIKTWFVSLSLSLSRERERKCGKT